jgi:chromate transporter
MNSSVADRTSAQRGVRVGTILATFLRLGCTSFGGPIAHLGYFRDEFVARRSWLDESQFAEIVALAQTLPGPASSQVGFTVGLLKGGWPGALAAWVGFTLPSALVMTAVAFVHPFLLGSNTRGVIRGLQIAAVAVIAQAVVMMQRRLAPDRVRATVAALGAAIALLASPHVSMIAAVSMGAASGLIFCRADGKDAPQRPFGAPLSKTTGVILLSVFLLLLLLPAFTLAHSPLPAVAVFNAFYRSGALVFGGGHVVLPLLESATVARGWLNESTFLAGYGAAQALPGPLFTFAAYLGAVLNVGPAGIIGACLALLSIFLPGLLLVSGILPFWARLRETEMVRAAITGVNASVVGVLGAALYRPVWTSTIERPLDLVLALTAFLLLMHWRLHPWKVVLITAAASALLSR